MLQNQGPPRTHIGNTELKAWGSPKRGKWMNASWTIVETPATTAIKQTRNKCCHFKRQTSLLHSNSLDFGFLSSRGMMSLGPSWQREGTKPLRWLRPICRQRGPQDFRLWCRRGPLSSPEWPRCHSPWRSGLDRKGVTSQSWSTWWLPANLNHPVEWQHNFSRWNCCWVFQLVHSVLSLEEQ